VDDRWGGAVRIVRGGGGMGREKSVSACPTPTRRRLWVQPFLPEGVACTSAPSPPRTGGYPRACPGSSGVIVVFLVEGVAWYVAIRIARSVVVIFRRAQRLRVVFVFVAQP
jgi:hypothetical protein